MQNGTLTQKIHRQLRCCNQPVATPDTGSVRGDLIALLRDASASRSDVAVLISVQVGEYFAETGRAPADLRAEFLSGRQQPFGIDDVLRRGVERGEIDPERLTPRIATVALGLLRHEMLMTLQPVSEKTITENRGRYLSAAGAPSRQSGSRHCALSLSKAA
jgi:hypothetical protein